MSRTPASIRAPATPIFSSVETTRGSSWSPSRALTSRSVTRSPMVACDLVGKSELSQDFGSVAVDRSGSRGETRLMVAELRHDAGHRNPLALLVGCLRDHAARAKVRIVGDVGHGH